jgi:hypothetical protein
MSFVGCPRDAVPGHTDECLLDEGEFWQYVNSPDKTPSKSGSQDPPSNIETSRYNIWQGKKHQLKRKSQQQ